MNSFISSFRPLIVAVIGILLVDPTMARRHAA